MTLFRTPALKVAALIAVFALGLGELGAQCAMCKAVAEDATEHATYGAAVGLNAGIIFLMAVPYVLLTVLTLVFFRKRLGNFFKSIHDIHS